MMTFLKDIKKLFVYNENTRLLLSIQDKRITDLVNRIRLLEESRVNNG